MDTPSKPETYEEQTARLNAAIEEYNRNPPPYTPRYGGYRRLEGDVESEIIAARRDHFAADTRR